MHRLFLLLVLVGTLGATDRLSIPRREYVPNEKTAEAIAQIVLVAQFGQDRVNEQLPLRAVSTSQDLWLVQGTLHGEHRLGGNFGVWINKHTGCIKIVEHMK